MKWQVVDGNVEGQSRYHDDGVPFVWRITETANGIYLTATPELVTPTFKKRFRNVVEAMTWADAEDASGETTPAKTCATCGTPESTDKDPCPDCGDFKNWKPKGAV